MRSVFKMSSERLFYGPRGSSQHVPRATTCSSGPLLSTARKVCPALPNTVWLVCDTLELFNLLCGMFWRGSCLKLRAVALHKNWHHRIVEANPDTQHQLPRVTSMHA